MYTRTNPPCPYCEQAKKLADSKNISYVNIDIGRDISIDKFMEKYPNARTVPLVIIDGDIIGGFSEFKNYILSKELGGMSL